MPTYIAISGPCHSGKTTLMNLLRGRYTDDHNVQFINDLHDDTWCDLVDKGSFGRFEEVYSDRDYLLLYCTQVIDRYIKIFKDYDKINDDTLVVLDGSYIDYLIYTILHLWYHYPSVEIQERMILKLLGTVGKVSKIFMVYADDDRYPVDSHTTTLRQRMANFKRNRKVELSLYDTYRSNSEVVNCTSDFLQTEAIVGDYIDQFLETHRLS